MILLALFACRPASVSLGASDDVRTSSYVGDCLPGYVLVGSTCVPEGDVVPTDDTAIEGDTDTDTDTDDTDPGDTDSQDTDTATEDTAVDLDLDGDGYPASADCDDADADVHPGAEEIYDALDNDCDGVADGTDLCPAADVVLNQMNFDLCEGYGITLRLDGGCLTNVSMESSTDGVVVPMNTPDDPGYVPAFWPFVWIASGFVATDTTEEFTLTSDQGTYTWTVEILDCF